MQIEKASDFLERLFRFRRGLIAVPFGVRDCFVYAQHHFDSSLHSDGVAQWQITRSGVWNCRRKEYFSKLYQWAIGCLRINHPAEALALLGKRTIKEGPNFGLGQRHRAPPEDLRIAHDPHDIGKITLSVGRQLKAMRAQWGRGRISRVS
jgi:hypothetical protein